MSAVRFEVEVEESGSPRIQCVRIRCSGAIDREFRLILPKAAEQQFLATTEVAAPQLVARYLDRPYVQVDILRLEAASLAASESSVLAITDTIIARTETPYNLNVLASFELEGVTFRKRINASNSGAIVLIVPATEYESRSEELFAIASSFQVQ